MLTIVHHCNRVRLTPSSGHHHARECCLDVERCPGGREATFTAQLDHTRGSAGGCRLTPFQQMVLPMVLGHAPCAASGHHVGGLVTKPGSFDSWRFSLKPSYPAPKLRSSIYVLFSDSFIHHVFEGCEKRTRLVGTKIARGQGCNYNEQW